MLRWHLRREEAQAEVPSLRRQLLWAGAAGICLVETPDDLVRHSCNNTAACRYFRTTAVSNSCANLLTGDDPR
jgi:hypothetical protein